MLRDVTNQVRSVLAPLSPGHRRWTRFLASLPLDETALPRPLPPPADRDFIICGCPRTGTTLAAAALFQPPAVVTVAEPWDGMRLPPAELFASLREEIDGTGQLTRGRLDIDALRDRGAAEWCEEGAKPVSVPVAGDWHLGVKWPGFWRYVEHLPSTRFVVCIRDPAEVIASFKATSGPSAHGLQRDVAFNRRLNGDLRAATNDRALRRVLLFDYVHERLLPHLGRDTVFVLRYERWFEDPSAVLNALGEFLGVDLGASLAVPRRAARPPVLDRRDRELLRQHCRTAAALGYDLP